MRVGVFCFYFLYGQTPVCATLVSVRQLNSTNLSRLACKGLALLRIGIPVCTCGVDPCKVLRQVACYDAFLLVFSCVAK